MEMQQLLNMGFSDDLASQALSATGGNIHEATEWILSQESDSKSPSTPPFQPKIDRFFNFQSKPPNKKQQAVNHNPAEVKAEGGTRNDDDEDDGSSSRKRPKLAAPPHEPLSERMRPRTLDQVVGQDHLLGAKTSVLRSAIDGNRLPSVLFWGPPGTGKTSIARAIANSCSSSCNVSIDNKGLVSFYRFVSLSAVTAGVKDVRDAVDEARKLKRLSNKRTILFIDEVHRFNKAQQDSLLPVIEDGSIVFMGATTENPSFHLITPLLSRCRVLTLNPLKTHHIASLLRRAVADCDKGLVRSVMANNVKIEVDDEAVEFLSSQCDGDARVALNALEVAATTAVARSINNTTINDEQNRAVTATVTIVDAKEALQCKHIAYDRAGEEHYNLISALHKSMRGSDADASIYWLARMLEGGEEPLYIARRLVRFASEDVGLADPLALVQAVACYQACHFLGMPECNVNLAQCVAYLALAPKSISVYQALLDAQKVVKASVGQNEAVPLHLRNAPTKLMKDLGYGKGYIYPPENPNASSQNYLPQSLQGHKFLHWPNSKSND